MGRDRPGCTILGWIHAYLGGDLRMSNRLTFSENGEFGVHGVDIQTLDIKLYLCICKLKGYEDSGLSPDQVMDMLDEIERLREALKGAMVIADEAKRVMRTAAAKKEDLHAPKP